jgi:hypothetical protein
MKRWLPWIIAGVLFGVLAALVAVGAAGAGHGTYVPAAVLFPYTMFFSVFVGSIAPVLVALALVQYPAYGALVALVRSSARVWFVLGGLHAVSVIGALFVMAQSGDFW